jgi:hypothetical protein
MYFGGGGVCVKDDLGVCDFGGQGDGRWDERGV